MPNLIYLTTIRSVGGGEFEIEVIDDGGRLWLKVSDMHRPRSILRFWSTKPNQAQTPSYTLLIDLLQDRLAYIGKLVVDPKNWTVIFKPDTVQKGDSTDAKTS